MFFESEQQEPTEKKFKARDRQEGESLIREKSVAVGMSEPAHGVARGEFGYSGGIREDGNRRHKQAQSNRKAGEFVFTQSQAPLRGAFVPEDTCENRRQQSQENEGCAKRVEIPIEFVYRNKREAAREVTIIERRVRLKAVNSKEDACDNADDGDTPLLFHS